MWVSSFLDLPKVLLLEAVRRLVMHYARTKLVMSVVVGVEICDGIDVLPLDVGRLRFPDHGASGAVLVFAILVVIGGRFAAYARIGVQTVVTVLWRRTVVGGAFVDIVEGSPILRARSLEIAMSFPEYGQARI